MHVVCSLSRAVFEEVLKANEHFADLFHFHNRTLDTGAVQDGPFRVQPLATLQRYHDTVHLQHGELVAQEVAFLARHGITDVVADATPVACAAGRAAGCRSVSILSNFTWDGMFASMLEELPEGPRGEGRAAHDAQMAAFASMVRQCERDYCAATAYLQLPGATPPPPGFDSNRVVPLPLLSRQATSPASAVRCAMEPAGAAAASGDTCKVLLLGFGGHSAEWTLVDSALPVGWRCWVLGATPQDMPSSGRWTAVPPDLSHRVPDLVAAADAVLGKLGYGFVSECICNDTPLVYVPRSHWPEEAYLEGYIAGPRGVGRAVRMPLEDFVGGQWEEYLVKAVGLSASTGANDSPAVDCAGALAAVCGQLLRSSS